MGGSFDKTETHEKIFELSYGVQVPPYSTVTISAWYEKIVNLTISYTAETEITGRGKRITKYGDVVEDSPVDSLTIRQFLKTEGFDGEVVKVTDYSVVIKVEGTLTADLGSNGQIGVYGKAINNDTTPDAEHTHCPFAQHAESELCLLPYGPWDEENDNDPLDQEVEWNSYASCVLLKFGPIFIFEKAEHHSICSDSHVGMFWVGPGKPDVVSTEFKCKRKLSHYTVLPFLNYFENPKKDDGKVYHRQTNDTKTMNYIRLLISPTFPEAAVTWAYIITWDNKAPAGSKSTHEGACPEPRNTFQAVAASGELESYVIFLYKKLEWGNPPDGCPGVIQGTELPVVNTTAGIQSEHGNIQFFLPNSCSAKFANLAKQSNIRRPGVWLYRVDGKKLPRP